MTHFFYRYPRALVVMFVLLLMILPQVVGAQPPFPGEQSPTTIQSPLAGNIDSLQELVEKILRDIVIPIGTPIAVLIIIYTGFLFVTARGNVEKLQRARTAFFWAIIGTAILLGSWVIAEVIGGTVNELTN